MAGIVKDGIPYVVDALGSLMAFNGSNFIEIARFPTDGNFLDGVEQENNVRSIHPNGMTILDDEILILIEEKRTTINLEKKLPSGVWAYNSINGLYHKYSIPLSDGSTVTDYGQPNISNAGAIFSLGRDVSSTEEGTLLVGAEYYTDSGSTNYWGVFYNNTDDDMQKYGYFVTSKIKSESIENNETSFKIKGSIEREGLVFIFKTLSDMLKNEI
jgi:hypothetical protein